MEIALILLAFLLLVAAGFNVYQQKRISDLFAARRQDELLLAKSLEDLREKQKENTKTLTREKISLEKKVKSLKVELSKKREELGVDELQNKIRDLSVELSQREIELEKRARLYAAIKSGKIPVSEEVAREVRDLVDRLSKRSTDISFRKACKKLIADIDRGLEESVEYREVAGNR